MAFREFAAGRVDWLAAGEFIESRATPFTERAVALLDDRRLEVRLLPAELHGVTRRQHYNVLHKPPFNFLIFVTHSRGIVMASVMSLVPND